MSKFKVDISQDEDGILVEVRETEQRRFKPSSVVSWSAFAISLISLSFSIYQGIQSRQHDRLSVIPSLALVPYGGEVRPEFGIYVENNGAGPAIVTAIDVIYNQTKISMEQLRGHLWTGHSPGLITYTDFSPNHFLRPGALEKLISSTGFDSDDHQQIWRAIREHTEIRITYCSVYGECKVACLHADSLTCEKITYY